jgi:hypothetical protein
MLEPPDLIAVHVAKDDVGTYHVTECGWYVVDGAEKVVLGPFESLGECDEAIRDRHTLVDSIPRRDDAAGSLTGTDLQRHSQ